MAENTAIIGFGAEVEWADTLGGSYVELAELLDLPLPETTVTAVEATHMKSPNSTMEKIPGLSEEGEFTFSMNFNKTQYNTVFGLTGQEKYFKINSPSGDTWGPFKGFVSGRAGDMPINDRIVAEITITPGGYIPFTPAA